MNDKKGMGSHKRIIYHVWALVSMISFGHVIHAQPANDFPCDAIELTVRESCSFDRFTNLDATGSGVPHPGCGNYQGGDVWFTVKVPDSGELEIHTYTESENKFPNNDGWIYGGGMGIYSGDCESLTIMECHFRDGTYHPRMTSTTLTGLTPGDTLYVRMWEAGNNEIGMFDICVVDLDPPDDLQSFDISGGGGFCQGDTGISVSLSGSEAGIHYTMILDDVLRLDTLVGTGLPLLWSPILSPGVYTVEAETQGSGSGLMMNGSVEVYEYPLPLLTTIASDASCANLDDGSIDLNIFGTEPFMVSWTGPDGFTSSLEDPGDLAPGIYQATVSDGNDCVNNTPEDTLTEPEAIVISVNTITPLSSYEAADGRVDISVVGGLPPYTFQWSGTDSYRSTREDPDNMTVGYYQVLVSDTALCTESLDGIRQITDAETDELFIPESFSPNGDGYNDRFVILGIENFAENELMVFNRQGVSVYYRANYQNDWDGTLEKERIQGGELPEGTYYYIFKYGPDGIRKGYVYINRE